MKKETLANVAAVREAHWGGVPTPREIARKVIGIFQQRHSARPQARH